MKILSMANAMLIFASLVGLATAVVTTRTAQLQECPTLVDPTSGSGSDPNITEMDYAYCLIDQCNIMLVATREKMEVTSVSADHLVSTNKTTQQSMSIARQSVERMCFFSFLFYGSYYIFSVLAFLFRFLLLVLIAVASSYTLGIHIILKVLRTLLGKLLIIYNVNVLIALFATLLLLASSLLFAPGSQAACQVFVHGYSLSFMMYESVGTVVTAQVYYLMYRDYNNMVDMSPTWSRQLFEHYVMFAYAPILPMAILTIGFDFTAQVGNQTILPSGHCILPPINLYESMFLAYMYIALHKVAQFLVFVYTLHYFHKLYTSFGSKRQKHHTTMKSTSQSVSQADTQPADDPNDSVSMNSSQNHSDTDDDSILESSPTPPDDDQEMQEHINPRVARDQMTEDEKRTEKKKYLRRLLISASFPLATILTLIFWFLCLAVGPLLKPFSAGGGDVALFVQQVIIAAVFLSSKKLFVVCKERLTSS